MSMTASQRQLPNDDEDDDAISSSRNSVISIDKDSKRGQSTPTTVTEYAVVHKSHAGEDVFILPPPFPTPTGSSLSTPQTPSYPVAPQFGSTETTPTASLETPTNHAPSFGNSHSFNSFHTARSDELYQVFLDLLITFSAFNRNYFSHRSHQTAVETDL